MCARRVHERVHIQNAAVILVMPTISLPGTNMFLMHDLDRDRPDKIFATSLSRPGYPCQTRYALILEVASFAHGTQHPIVSVEQTRGRSFKTISVLPLFLTVWSVTKSAIVTQTTSLSISGQTTLTIWLGFRCRKCNLTANALNLKLRILNETIPDKNFVILLLLNSQCLILFF